MATGVIQAIYKVNMVVFTGTRLAAADMEWEAVLEAKATVMPGFLDTINTEETPITITSSVVAGAAIIIREGMLPLVASAGVSPRLATVRGTAETFLLTPPTLMCLATFHINMRDFYLPTKTFTAELQTATLREIPTVHPGLDSTGRGLAFLSIGSFFYFIFFIFLAYFQCAVHALCPQLAHPS